MTPATSKTNDALIDSLTTGFQWDNSGPITYSFTGVETTTLPQPQAVMDAIHQVFREIKYFTAATFEFSGIFSSPEIAHSSGANLNIALDGYGLFSRFDRSSLATGLPPNELYANTYLGPKLSYTGSEGDIFINDQSQAMSYAYIPGDTGFFMVLHEIGHALGLKHPHDDGGVSRLTFNQSGLRNLDLDWLSMMSYKDTFRQVTSAFEPKAPMILDIIALQYMYGVNTVTNLGDTKFLIDLNSNWYSSIFDTSGSDTVDVSDSMYGAYIDLPKYVFSDYQISPAGLITRINEQENISPGRSPKNLTWVLGAIENVIGTPFDDLISDSDGSETIKSGDGCDRIYLRDGNDVVDGGKGTDLIFLRSRREDCEIVIKNNVYSISSQLDGHKMLTNIEAVVFDYNGDNELRTMEDLENPLDAPKSSENGTIVLLKDGQVQILGGNIAIFGTSGHQDVTIEDAAGVISLDQSFNRGGDILRLPGIASNWLAKVWGCGVVLFDGDTFIEIPVGPKGLALVWDGGAAQLRLDLLAGEIKIGDQVMSDYYLSFVGQSGVGIDISDHSSFRIGIPITQLSIIDYSIIASDLLLDLHGVGPFS